MGCIETPCESLGHAHRTIPLAHRHPFGQHDNLITRIEGMSIPSSAIPESSVLTFASISNGHVDKSARFHV